MINDASKNINRKKIVDKNEKTFTMLRGKKITGDKNSDVECSGDFPIKPTFTGTNNDNNNTNTAIVADVSKMRSTATTTKLTETEKTTATRATETTSWCHPENKGETAKLTTTRQLTTINRKKISPTTKTTTATASAIITTSTKPPPTHTKRMEAKSRTIPSTKKSHTLRKNKCPASEPNEISSQRAAQPTTSKSQTSIYGRIISNTTATKTSKSKNIQCKSLESIGIKQTLPTKEKPASSILTLSEQKAQLRSEFFKDIKSKQSEAEIGVELIEGEEEFSIFEEYQNNPISKRIWKRNSKQKLNTQQIEIAPDSGSEKFSEDEQTVLVPFIQTETGGKLSLIDRRKLELAQKFTAQKTVRHRRNRESPLIEFRRVAQLVKKFDQINSDMIVNPQNKDGVEYSTEQTMLTLKPDAQDQRHNSPLSDEGCNLGQSPYSTDDERDDNDDNISIRTTSTMIETSRSSRRKDKVARSASSDSALGLDVDDPMDASSTAPMTPPNEHQQQKRRKTLTVTDLPLRPALLPLAEPTSLPDSPTPEIQQNLQSLLAQTTVPSKVLLKERVVEMTEPILRSTCTSNVSSHATSRRESEQSSIGDYPLSEPGVVPGVRYVRTPSVVVSDYSDDVMCGITLEEIEYFRAQRLRRRSSLDATGIDSTDSHSDVSASSSCSNLYYCGSTISALDGSECLVNGRRVELQRKASDCSTCSTSGNEDETTSTSTLTEDSSNRDISDLLAAQHLCSKRAKKVGLPSEPKGLPTSLNINDKEMAESPYLASK